MDKLWLQHYQQGVPYEIDTRTYRSLAHLFDESCQKYQQHPAYFNMGSTITYQELDEQSRALAAYWQSQGLQRGDRIAIMMPNVLQYPVVLFAILRAGFVVVNTNPLYTADEVVHQLSDSGAKALVVLANFGKTIEEALPKLPELQHILVTEIGDLFTPIKRVIVNSVVRYVKKMIPPYRLPNAISLRTALALGQKKPFTVVNLQHQDMAFLQYTGGTTGIAKGAILTHGNMVANVLQAQAFAKPLSLNEESIIITALPLYHIFSLTANCLLFLAVGAKNILITNPRDITTFIKEIKDTHFTAITGVNTLFNALLSHPSVRDIDFSKLQLALSGGMALQKNVALKWHEVTHSPVLEAYGLTETSPAVTINPLNLTGYNGSIGLPLPSTDISLRDSEGHEVPIGERGELCVKGPQVTPGYWHRPDETKEAFWADGFFRTGDIAVIDNEGFLYLVDRKKDMIIVSGFNVYPNEVEQVIGTLPGVLEVGVIGVKENGTDERVKACIVKRDPSLTKEEVIAHCREHLTAYKVPKIVEFYSELPKTNVGKILRRALK